MDLLERVGTVLGVARGGFRRMHQILLGKHLWMVSAATLAIGIALVILLHHFFFFFSERLTKRG